MSGVHKHLRNLDDEQLKAIADTGGTIGVMYESSFLGPSRWKGRASMVADHIMHIVERQAKAKAGADAVFEEMKRLDGVMTTWTDTSEVSKVNLAAGDKPVVVSDETYAVIARAVDVSRRTNGIFDITVGSFKGLWKFDQDMDYTLPDPADVKKRLANIGWKHLKIDPKAKTVFIDKKGVSITLGGIAKVYAVDKCVEIMRKQGFVDFMVQAGGDMYLAGKKDTAPWVVGIRDPRGAEGSMFAVARSRTTRSRRQAPTSAASSTRRTGSATITSSIRGPACPLADEATSPRSHDQVPQGYDGTQSACWSDHETKRCILDGAWSCPLRGMRGRRR